MLFHLSPLLPWALPSFLKVNIFQLDQESSVNHLSIYLSRRSKKLAKVDWSEGKEAYSCWRRPWLASANQDLSSEDRNERSSWVKQSLSWTMLTTVMAIRIAAQLDRNLILWYALFGPVGYWMNVEVVLSPDLLMELAIVARILGSFILVCVSARLFWSFGYEWSTLCKGQSGTNTSSPLHTYISDLISTTLFPLNSHLEETCFN